MRAHLAQAERRLVAARHLLAARDHEDAVSRAYYAALHAVNAALASRGLQAKTQAGARRLFALHFVQPGLVPVDAGRGIESLQRDRQGGADDPAPPATTDHAGGAIGMVPLRPQPAA